MVTYIVIEHNLQNDTLNTSKPFFSHEDATKEMWRLFGNALNSNENNTRFDAEGAMAFAKENNLDYSDYYVKDALFYEAEVHSVLFSEDDMLTMLILDTFYSMFPEFKDYQKGEWRAKFQDMLVYHINHLLPRYKNNWRRESTEDFINECLIGEELYETAVAELGGDVNRTEEILNFIDEHPSFATIVRDIYGFNGVNGNVLVCGLLTLSYGEKEIVERVRQAINEWCLGRKEAPIFVEPQYVYRVCGYYDMDICTGEEIIQEIYATEELAQKRCKQLIAQWKKNGYTKEDSGGWKETETSLWAYCDSSWNVDISYTKEEVKTSC